MPQTVTTLPVAVSATLARNLDALSQSSPELAASLLQVQASDDIEFLETPQGVPAARYQDKAVCSRKRPLDEASRLAESVDLASAGLVAVLGFGLGYHVDALLRRANGTAEVLVFEPDLALLRAALERIDHSGWLGSPKLHFVTDADNAAGLASVLQGHEPFVALGVKILEHPASVSRLGGSALALSTNLATLVGAIRTMVVTTMVQTEVTIRNALMNLDSYLLANDSPHAGVADLHDLCRGRPAVLVAAGPSLARTIDALKTEGLRDRCVIIAVQTVLKQLLDAGVRPHFVTALDYHAISTRFYEGLTREDVQGITLIAEPKVNPAVPEAWPGAIRCPSDGTLELLLGTMASEHGTVPGGSTVAHLNYYLARYMGCNPVILTGQDLGFTDGQYYGDGATIHNVWACELNPFTTLEMFEWERIVRGRPNLQKAQDHLGRAIYTDDQMAAYLSQFERDFLNDENQGKTTIDATQGGVAKSHTVAMTLADALQAHAPEDAAPLPVIPDAPRRGSLGKGASRSAKQHLLGVRQDAVRFVSLSRKSRRLLEQALENAHDTETLTSLVERVYQYRDEAHALQPAFTLIQRMNQTGAFNRAKADRELKLAMADTPDMSAADIRKHQLARDITNVTWLADAADTLAQMLLDASHALEGGEKPTALPAARIEVEEDTKPLPGKVAAVIVDEGDPTALERTIARVQRCRGIDECIVVTDDATWSAPDGVVVHHADLTEARQRAGRMRSARRFSAHCWRSGVNALTCFDPIAAPAEACVALDAAGASAALLVGASWNDLDIDSCAALIERHKEHPAQHRVVFCQAPPGQAGIVIETELLREIAKAADSHSPFATIGGLLGYNPLRPTADPIAKPLCVEIAHTQRDQPWNQSSRTLREIAGPVPAHVILELTTQRSCWGGQRDAWFQSRTHEELHADAADIKTLLDQLSSHRNDACVTFAGTGDPLLHEDLADLVQHARQLGIATHVRTDLLASDAQLDALRENPPDVLSVDVLAIDAQMYELITGSNQWDTLARRIEALWNDRDCVLGAPAMWLVPRMTRCDAVYEQIERFYDFWMAHTGSAVLDPLPGTMAGERIVPFTLPRVAANARNATTLSIRADGKACQLASDTCLGGVFAMPAHTALPDLWQQINAQRFPEQS